MTPDPYDAWEPWTVGTEITNGPSRIYDNDADNETPPPRLIGFTNHLDPEPEPLLWNGDNA